METITVNQNAETLILKALGERTRFRRKTDLSRLYRSMSDKVPRQDFYAVFKKLAQNGAGSLIIGRRNNPDRFAWNYNLKEVAARAAKGQDIQSLPELPPKARTRRMVKKDVRIEKRKVVRRQELSPAKENNTVATIQVSFQVPANTPQSEILALIDLAKSLQK